MTIGASPDLVHAGSYLVADASIDFSTNDAAFASAVRWVFRDLAAPPEARTLPTHRFVVRRNVEPWVHWGIWRDGEPCETSLEEGYVLFHVQWELNRIALERSTTTVHAAAVEADGRSVVLIGPSMSGKTTMAGWLSTAGFRYLADEIVAFDASGNALPYLRPLGVRDGPLRLLMAETDPVDARFFQYESLAPVSSLAGASICMTPAPPALMIFPTYENGADCSSSQLSGAIGLERLCQSSPGLSRHGRVVFEALAELALAIPMIELRFGRIEDAMSSVERALTGMTGKSLA